MTQRTPLASPKLLTRRAALQFAGLALAGAGLTGCGFRLRGSQVFAFQRIAIGPQPGGAVAQELRRSFGSAVQVLATGTPADIRADRAVQAAAQGVEGVAGHGQGQAVADRRNILVAGGTSTGKTTLTNALLAEVSKTSDRVVLIEDTRELQCAAPNLVSLRTKDGIATLSDLVRSALRLRPDRIVLGELRGAPETSDVPIIVVSGLADAGTLKGVMRTGANHRRIPEPEVLRMRELMHTQMRKGIQEIEEFNGDLRQRELDEARKTVTRRWVAKAP